MSALITTLIEQPTRPPSLYLDLEGVNLSRQGSISILQIHVAPHNRSFLIDIHALGHKAFETSDKLDRSLRIILESEIIPKVFFDVRNDSDALFSHFKIRLAGVIDLQVMEYATRTFQKKFVSGLSKCVERDLPLSYSQIRQCQHVKEEGLKMFAPERGGSYEIFNERPLSKAIVMYCVQDVQWLPELYKQYKRKLMGKSMETKVARATLDRVRESQSASYIGHGRHKALGPW